MCKSNLIDNQSKIMDNFNEIIDKLTIILEIMKSKRGART